ncbi:hypothetical protein CIL03_02265 [Virgibacillus indicus]|uniref:Competence protein ComG n=1 Tax=Virgibacillus indicus TaxID=2024554 RepID=A0A265ND50_9BACI|nr:hypothetical protein [Virgibacillus indicus]OZU89980.1 hypothetical protein CIL03_02265 [Virgibacillus indicus]
MRKQLFFINNEKGFFLPYVLFIISIIFIVITANITNYKNEIYITDAYLEQLKIETLFQMGHAELKEDVKNSEDMIDKKSYIFPDGNVEISLISFTEEIFHFDFNISTRKHPQYSIIHYMSIPDVQPEE